MLKELLAYIVPLLLWGALSGVLNLIFTRKSQIEAWVNANPRLAAWSKFLRSIGFDPWAAHAWLTLLVKKKLPEAQQADSLVAQLEQRKADAKSLAEPRSMRMPPPMMMLMVLLLSALSCSPAQWQAQDRAASLVQQAADFVALPALERAEREAGMLAIQRATTRAEAEAGLDAVRARYRPAWACWDAFQAAHAAWLTAIETKADPLPSAAAARAAFCRLRVASSAVGVRLPDFPVARCT